MMQLCRIVRTQLDYASLFYPGSESFIGFISGHSDYRISPILLKTLLSDLNWRLVLFYIGDERVKPSLPNG